MRKTDNQLIKMVGGYAFELSKMDVVLDLLVNKPKTLALMKKW